MDKYSVLAKAAYIEAVDQNVAILPRGRSLNPNATGQIVLTTAADYSKITNPDLTAVADDDARTITGINGCGLFGVRPDFNRPFAGRQADWTAVYFT
jgi:hypothetical protein